MTATMPRRFLDAILDDPDEDGPRLVFADWLEEHRQGARAKWVRLACRRWRQDATSWPDYALEKREAWQCSKCRPRWWRGFPRGMKVRPWRGLYEFEVQSLTAIKALGRCPAAARAIAEAWVEAIQVRELTAPMLDALAAWPDELRSAPMRITLSSELFGSRGRDLAALPGLRDLFIMGRGRPRPTDLSALADLPGVQALELWEGDAVDVRPLAGRFGLRKLELWADRLSDSDLAPLATLAGLRTLEVRSSERGGLTLAPLAGLTGLRELDVGFQELTDQALPALAGLTGLRRLDLSMTKVTDAGLRHLAGLTRLESLSLSNSDDIRDLDWAAGLTRMRRLDLFGCAVTDDALANLSGMTGLESLELAYCKELRGDGLRHLEGLTALEDLRLYNCTGLKEGLSSLARLKRLRYLNLSSCPKLGGLDFTPLADLPRMALLVIPRRGGGDAQAALLRKHRPGLDVRTG